MLRYLILLISTFLPAIVHSQMLEYNISGYITTTLFSNDEWFTDTKKAAVNVDVHYDSYSIHTQLQTSKEKPISRFKIEKEFFISKNHDIQLSLGLFPRLSSFFNNVTDSPSSTMMAMVPFGEYNYRILYNNTFNSIKGIGFKYSYFDELNNLSLLFNYGYADIEDNTFINKEIFRVKRPVGYNWSSNKGNYNLSAIYKRNDLELLISTSNTDIKNTRTSDYEFYSDINNIDCLMSRVGFRYTPNDYWVQGVLISSLLKYSDINNKTLNEIRADTGYILFGYKWTDKFSTHAVYSKSEIKNNINLNKQYPVDISVGATYIYGDFTTSLDYHQNKGKEWSNLFTSSEEQSSWVLSATYSF